MDTLNNKDIESPKTRSLAQNRSIHLFCEMLAKDLNEAGLDMKIVLKPEVDIEWTKDTVKKYIWKPIQQALTTKESSTELDTKEPSKVWETINRHLGMKFGFSIPTFPSEEQTKEYLKSLDKSNE